MNKKHILTVMLAALLLGLASCKETPNTTSQKIDALKTQVSNDAKAVKELGNKQFADLHNDFMVCDSMLQYLKDEQIDACFDILNLTQAYLEQFELVKPVMLSKMDYISTQLDNLKADLASQFVSDSLALVYLNDESRVADTLHQQLLYFEDRFGKCQQDINNLKNSWKQIQ